MRTCLLAVDLQECFLSNTSAKDIAQDIIYNTSTKQFDYYMFSKFSKYKGDKRFNLMSNIKDGADYIYHHTDSNLMSSEFIRILRDEDIDKIYLCGVNECGMLYLFAQQLKLSNIPFEIMMNYVVSPGGMRCELITKDLLQSSFPNECNENIKLDIY